MSYLWRKTANILKDYCVGKTWWEGVGSNTFQFNILYISLTWGKDEVSTVFLIFKISYVGEPTVNMKS